MTQNLEKNIEEAHVMQSMKSEQAPQETAPPSPTPSSPPPDTHIDSAEAEKALIMQNTYELYKALEADKLAKEKEERIKKDPMYAIEDALNGEELGDSRDYVAKYLKDVASEVGLTPEQAVKLATITLAKDREMIKEMETKKTREDDEYKGWLTKTYGLNGLDLENDARSYWGRNGESLDLLDAQPADKRKALFQNYIKARNAGTLEERSPPGNAPKKRVLNSKILPRFEN